MERMMLKLSNELDLPISAVTQTFAFLGKRGGGKTYAAGKFAEELLTQKAQIIAIDVVGTWYGLRIPKDKVNSPFDLVIFGGRHGDVPINPKAGKIVARAILERNLSAVVDISEFIHSEQVRYCYDFLTELLEYRKEHPAACHLFFEEAQELVPQNPPPKSEGENYAARLMHIGNRVVKLGRNFGIGCSLISQRPQEVNKKILDMCEVVLAFQMTGLSPRKTITDIARDEEIDIDINALLPKLEVGQAFVWSPSWLKISGVYKIGEKITADVSATPVFGSEPVETQRLAPVDVADLSKTIEALTAEAEANTPAALKKQISELNKEINALRMNADSGKPAVKEVEVIKEVPVFPVQLRHQLEDKADRIENEIEIIRLSAKAAVEMVRDIRQMLDTFSEIKPPVGEAVHRASPSASSERPKQAPHVTDRLKSSAHVTNEPKSTPNVKSGLISHNGHLPEGEYKILTICGQYPSGSDRDQITVLSGFKKSTRDAYINRLSQKGYVEAPRGGSITITNAGLEALGPGFEPLPTGRELQEYWLARLPVGEAQILRFAIENYPNEVSREMLSDNTGFKKSTRDAYINRLQTKRLMVVCGPGWVTASDKLFD